MATKKVPEITELKPFKLKIAGLTWTVVFEDDLHDDDGRSLCGCCYSDRFTISVQKNMTMPTTRVTIWHEIFHAALSGISNTGERNDEEHIVELSGRAINEIFAQQKRLPKWLFEGVN